MTSVGLVACGKRKRPSAAKALDLYTGSLFRKASAYCGLTYDSWYILSAKHGLLEPDQWVEPYDLTLNGLSPDARRRWAEGVLAEIEQRGLDGSEFYLHAGERYSEFLAPRLRAERPLAGLGIGKQLAWYCARGL